jgi:sulfate permease, SulP family
MEAATKEEHIETSTQPFWKRYRKTLSSDLIAGATGAVAGAPQAMAFALIAGVNPIYGLYTAIVATIIGAFTTASTYMTVGNTNAVALVVGATLLRYDEALRFEPLIVLTLMVGLIQLLFGVLRLGALTRFVSNAVMTGFITGAGVLIINGQLQHITGYAVKNRAAIPRFFEWLSRLADSNPQSVFIGLLALTIIVLLRKTPLKNAAILSALVITAVIIKVLGWQDVAIVSTISEIPSGFPAFVIPKWDYVGDLLNPALALAILALVQSAALVQSIPEPNEQNVSRDFMGQGIANIGAAFFQGIPSGGSLSRTAINISAGAKTRLANVFAGLFILLIVLLFSKGIEQVALAALAGQLIFAAISLIRPKTIATVWQVSWTARLTMLATFISTLTLPLEYSIYIGVGLSLALYVYSSAAWLEVTHLVQVGSHQYKEETMPDTLPADKAIVFSIYGNMFFAAVTHLEELLPDPKTANHTVVILRLRHNPFMGSTGLRFFREYAETLTEHNSKLVLAGIGENVQGQLERADTVSENNGLLKIFLADGIVFSATERALEYAQEWLSRK